MSRRELMAMDDTLWIRSFLPLARVEIDSGPRTEEQLYASWSRCSAALRSGKTSRGHTVLAEAFCRLMSLRQGVLECRK